MITPELKCNHFECREKVSLPFIIEPLTILIDNNAVVVTLNNNIRLGVNAVERSSSITADFQGHVKSLATVVLETWCNELKLMGLGANILCLHFAVSFESTTSEHHVGSIQAFQDTVGLAGPVVQ